MFEELQDYKVKFVKGLQDYICLEGKGYKITRKEGLQESFWERGWAMLDLSFEPDNWTLKLDFGNGP